MTSDSVTDMILDLQQVIRFIWFGHSDTRNIVFEPRPKWQITSIHWGFGFFFCTEIVSLASNELTVIGRESNVSTIRTITSTRTDGIQHRSQHTTRTHSLCFTRRCVVRNGIFLHEFSTTFSLHRNSHSTINKWRAANSENEHENEEFCWKRNHRMSVVVCVCGSMDGSVCVSVSVCVFVCQPAPCRASSVFRSLFFQIKYYWLVPRRCLCVAKQSFQCWMQIIIVLSTGIGWITARCTTPKIGHIHSFDHWLHSHWPVVTCTFHWNFSGIFTVILLNFPKHIFLKENLGTFVMKPLCEATKCNSSSQQVFDNLMTKFSFNEIFFFYEQFFTKQQQEKNQQKKASPPSMSSPTRWR